MDPKPATLGAAAAPSQLPVPLENASPAGRFVTVLTPVDKRALVGDEHDVDANGVRLHAWGAPALKAFDVRSGYFWAVTLCPCVSLAQLETRMGVRSYALALISAALSYAVFDVCFVGVLVSFCSLWRTDARHAATFVYCLLGFATFTVLIGLRVAELRTRVRERFLIPGSAREDRFVGFLHTTRALRQMGHHLKCDRVAFCSAPAVLHAYEV